MQRRAFLHTSLATLGTATAGQLMAADPRPTSRELYELRAYHLKADRQKALDDYLGKAFLPALGRLGIGPVGVFTEKAGTETTTVRVLIVHPTAESVVTLPDRLAADEEHQKAATDYLAARSNDPVYTRIDSSLLAAIDGMPRLDKPDTSRPRLLNLRIYESHNERAGRKKIEMFNKGELDIFRRVGLTPVFFAAALVGSNLPNLTYMLAFPDEDGRKAAWDRFRGDAEWIKLRSLPEYADKEIVSRITNLVLTPASCSQI